MKVLFVLFFGFFAFLNMNLSATPLDEIFKDVNVSGSVRYRFEHNSPKNKNNQNYQQRIQIPMH